MKTPRPGGCLAGAEPLGAQPGQPYREAHRRSGRVFVRDGTALGEVHVPGLGVVPGQLRMH
jgi:hypothetical protein